MRMLLRVRVMIIRQLTKLREKNNYVPFVLRKYEIGTQVRNLHSYVSGPVELLRTSC